MKRKATNFIQSLTKRQRQLGFVVFSVALLLGVIQFIPAQRSVGAYCKVYKQENAKLATATGNTYSVAVFSHSSSNPGDFTAAFNKLDRVAPDDIEQDVKNLKKIFETIERDPSQTMAASLSGISAESTVSKWTSERCGK